MRALLALSAACLLPACTTAPISAARVQTVSLAGIEKPVRTAQAANENGRTHAQKALGYIRRARRFAQDGKTIIP